jgi:hypothetical protein
MIWTMDLFGCYRFSLINTSFTDRFKITFTMDFSRTGRRQCLVCVCPTVAFTFRMKDSTEILFFTDPEPDTMFGNRLNNNVASTGAAFVARLPSNKYKLLIFCLNLVICCPCRFDIPPRSSACVVSDFDASSRYSGASRALITVSAV